MKRIIYLTFIIIVAGCSANPQYGDSGGAKRQVHSKYTTKLSKAKVNESIAKAEKIDVKVGDNLTFVCSYYGKKFHGRPTANGETFDMYKLTAAHKNLPFNTKLKVTNPDNGKSVIVRVTDRGPFVEGRDLDLSFAAAKQIGLIAYGVKELKIEVIEVGK